MTAYNFDSYTTGAPPPAPWEVVVDPGSSVLVDATVYKGASGKSAKILSDSGAHRANLWMKGLTISGTAFKVKFSMRMAVNGSGAYGRAAGLTNETIGTVLLLMGVVFNDDFHIYVIETPDVWGAVHDTGVVWTLDTWYDFEMTVDVESMEFHIEFGGNRYPTIGEYAFVELADAFRAYAADSTNYWYLDDFEYDDIITPATFSRARCVDSGGCNRLSRSGMVNGG